MCVDPFFLLFNQSDPDNSCCWTLNSIHLIIRPEKDFVFPHTARWLKRLPTPEVNSQWILRWPCELWYGTFAALDVGSILSQFFWLVQIFIQKSGNFFILYLKCFWAIISCSCLAEWMEIRFVICLLPYLLARLRTGKHVLMKFKFTKNLQTD